MSAKVTFRKSDLVRACRAMEEAGLNVAGAKISPDGTIVVLTGKSVANDINPLDRVLAR